MKLLHAIYSSPVELLSKAEGDGSELVTAVRHQDKAKARAALFNFAITAYHVWDWVKANRPDLNRPATNPLSSGESLAACRDLANASKHAVLVVTKGSYRKHPPVVQSVAVSAIGRAGVPIAATSTAPNGPPTAWRLKVQLASGRRLPVEDLVAEALGAWKAYFARHSIK